MDAIPASLMTSSHHGNSNHLNFQWQDFHSTMLQALHKMGCAVDGKHIGPVPEVHIRLGQQEIRVHATLLAALSSSWRAYLQSAPQEVTIVYGIMLEVRPDLDTLGIIKSLLYSGEAVVSAVGVKEVLLVAQALSLDHTQLLRVCSSNNVCTMRWERHKDRLMENLQLMCCHQQCTDLSILVNGYVIKAHKLVLSACSPVFSATFCANRNLRTIHIPGITETHAQCLITYIYYGQISISKNDLHPIHSLSSSLEVKSLRDALKKLAPQLSDCSQESEAGDLIQLNAKVRPELQGAWERLHKLYENGTHADLTLIAGSKQLPAHKALVSAVCPHLHEVLTQEIGSDKHSAILFSDLNYTCVKSVLDLIYRGTCTISEKYRESVCANLDALVFDIEVIHLKEGMRKCENFSDAKLSTSRVPFILKSGIKKADVRPANPYSQAGMARPVSSRPVVINRETNIHQVQSEISEEGAANGLSKKNVNSEESGFLTEEDELHANDVGGMSVVSEDISHGLDHSDDNMSDREMCSSSVQVNKSEFDDDCRKNAHYVKKRQYTCLLCPSKFPTQTLLKVHCQTEHFNKNSFKKCEHCGKSYTRTSDLMAHINTHTGELQYTCELCNKSFAHQGAMNQHRKTHEDNKELIVCEMCGKSYLRNALWLHMKSHTLEHECVHCGKKFSMKRLRDEHIKVNHSGLDQHEFKCTECSMSFISSSRRHTHMMQVHVANEKDKFMCQYCKRTYKNERRLKVHLASHGLRIKPYRCERCPADYFSHQSLIIHQRQFHTLDLPFACSVCGKRFSRLRSAKRHEESHYMCLDENDISGTASIEATPVSPEVDSVDASTSEAKVIENVDQLCKFTRKSSESKDGSGGSKKNQEGANVSGEESARGMTSNRTSTSVVKSTMTIMSQSVEPILKSTMAITAPSTEPIFKSAMAMKPPSVEPVLKSTMAIMSQSVEPVLKSTMPIMSQSVKPVLNSTMAIKTPSVEPVLKSTMAIKPPSVEPVLKSTMAIMSQSVEPVLKSTMAIKTSSVEPVLKSTMAIKPPSVEPSIQNVKESHYICGKCNITFSEEHLLNSHLLTHMEELHHMPLIYSMDDIGHESQTIENVKHVKNDSLQPHEDQSSGPLMKTTFSYSRHTENGVGSSRSLPVSKSAQTQVENSMNISNNSMGLPNTSDSHSCQAMVSSRIDAQVKESERSVSNGSLVTGLEDLVNELNFPELKFSAQSETLQSSVSSASITARESETYHNSGDVHQIQPLIEDAWEVAGFEFGHQK